MDNAQLINQTSGDTEYYTDPKIIAAATIVLGSIDLDPASSKAANKIVDASRFFTKADEPLKRSWDGTVWMNHPFHGGWKACTYDCQRETCRKRGFHIHEDIPSNADWINKYVNQYRAGNIVEALNITYAATSETWFQPLLKFPQCFLWPRTNYYLPNGEIKKGVTKGSVITYLGDHVAHFAHIFKSFGTIKIKYEQTR